MRKFYVVAPGGFTTGGIELAHQLVSSLNENDLKAYIVYSPFNFDFTIPSSYKKYNVKVAKANEITDDSNSVIVLPEIYTGYAVEFNKASIYIWWMSVDNYFSIQPKGFVNKIKSILKRLIKHKNARPKQIPIECLSTYHHLTQSQYAKDFISTYGFESDMLSDFLNEEHLNKNVLLENKENIICYNPHKGAQYTQILIERLPHYKFVPIKNMSATEVSNLLDLAKIYIDFGNHPGKDRIPREAVMASCVVITGLQGSASNEIDIPVDKKYKIDEADIKFVDRVDCLVKEVFTNFAMSHEDFDGYRNKIKNERQVFDKEVITIFKN